MVQWHVHKQVVILRILMTKSFEHYSNHNFYITQADNAPTLQWRGLANADKCTQTCFTVVFYKKLIHEWTVSYSKLIFSNFWVIH